MFTSRVKKEYQEYREGVKSTGGDPRPPPPGFYEEMTLAASLMSAELGLLIFPRFNFVQYYHVISYLLIGIFFLT